MIADRHQTSSSAEKQTLFQILCETNELKKPSSSEVFLICATNDCDSLDFAARRRFTFISVNMPTQQDRIDLFEYYLNDNHTLTKANFEFLATKTDGFSGSDIEKIVATATTFHYQKLYRQELSSKKDKIPKFSKITFDQLKYIVENSSPSIESYELQESEEFKEKFDCLMYDKMSKPTNQKPKFIKKSILPGSKMNQGTIRVSMQSSCPAAM